MMTEPRRASHPNVVEDEDGSPIFIADGVSGAALVARIEEVEKRYVILWDEGPLDMESGELYYPLIPRTLKEAA